MLVFGGHGHPRWGVIQALSPPHPPTQENQAPSSRLPEIVAGGHIVVHIPGVQAAEGVPGQAEGGGSVQVAIPVDLDTHDTSLQVVSRDSKLSSGPILEQDALKAVSEKPGASAYLNGHVLEAVPCILHYFAKTEYGAEGICYGIINARFEVGRGDVGKNIPPKVRRKQK